MKTTVITSKGTTTIPKTVRSELGLIEGSYITFQKTSNGGYLIKPVVTIGELRKRNQKILARENVSLVDYRSGDGFRAHTTKVLNES